MKNLPTHQLQHLAAQIRLTFSRISSRRMSAHSRLQWRAHYKTVLSELKCRGILFNSRKFKWRS